MEFFRPLLQENGITEQQWRVLRALHSYGELESKQLAQHCCILSPSLTGIISRLETLGYIKRRKSPEDQRRSLISLTDKALEMFERLRPEFDGRYQLLSDKIGEDKMEQLSKILNEIAQLKP